MASEIVGSIESKVKSTGSTKASSFGIPMSSVETHGGSSDDGIGIAF